jgi:hypothetical protein
MEAFSDAQVTAEIERLNAELSDATKSVAYLTGELEAVRDIAYRAGAGAAARDALEAIFQRTSRAVGKGT